MKPQNSHEVLESIILESKNPIVDKKSFNILWIYLILVVVFWVLLVSRAWIIYIIIWMWLLWWAAHMLQSIYSSIKKEETFRMVAKNYKLFPSADSCVEYLYLNNLIFSRYNESWKIWIYLQPVLSIISWLVIYFVLRSIIQISLGWNMTWEPNIYFYWFFAFLSWFFYEKFLDFLNSLSQKLSKNMQINDEILSRIQDFDTTKSKVSLKIKKELNK